MLKSHAMPLTIVGGALAALLIAWATATPYQRPIDPMTACYIALSQDLAPLLHRGVPDMAATSPECAPPIGNRGRSPRQALRTPAANRPVQLRRYDSLGRAASAVTGSERIRLPVAAKIALQSAGAMGGTPGSPTPPIGMS
jgi:hypothetical protein